MKRAFLIVALLVSSLAFSYVLVSIRPLMFIVKELYPGQVQVLIDPNSNPHMFSLTPSSMKKIYKSDVLIVFGSGFEEWIKKVKADVCYAAKGMDKEMDANPHVWLNPKLMGKAASNIKECLERVYPDKKDEIEKNYKKFLDKLEKLDEELRKDFSDKNGTVLELRPALYHFLKEYFKGEYYTVIGQTQSSLSARSLKDIIKVCKEKSLKKIIIEKSSSKKIALPLLRECRLKELEVDVLGADVRSYEEFILSVEKVVLEALK
ncbi:MAG: zinc ABC transporter substrate-binding protein [Thermotogaceae bacterium]|nr:zinc ABC transporter substrate-binding protein [Thermotogaceae bacterium]